MKRVWLGLSFFKWALVLSLFFAVCTPIGDAHGASSISGRVVDSVTSAGIGNVTVMAVTGIPGQVGAGLTDVAGNFLFSVPADGTYSVSFMKTGYVSLIGPTARTVVVSGNTAMGQVSMTSTGAGHSVSGKVINAKTFTALSGVTVTATDPSGNAAGSNATDSSGNFSITLPADGLYYLTFVKTGYTSMTGSQAIPAMVIGNYAIGSIPMTPTTKLDLAQGWNFISLPKLPPSSTAVMDVLSDVSADLTIVWGYDNETKQWLKYRPSGPSNTLFSLRPGLGYWIYLQNAGSLDTSWWLDLGTHSMHVYKGWNLLGYNGTDSVNWATALLSISGKWTILWTWDTKWYVKSPILPNLSFDPITALRLGKAYWVKGDAEAKWLQSTDASGNVWVIGSTPTDLASGLSSTTLVQAQMWNDIDPSSVTGNSVGLYSKGEFGLSRNAGLATYDEVKNIITFQLQGGGLHSGADYTLTLKGGAIKDTSGKFMFDDYNTSFSTVRNDLKKYVDYKPDKTVKEYGVYEFDGNGNATRHIHYEDAGPDLTWFTADDVVSYYETYAMPVYAVFGIKTRYDGPGNDGVWFTADDEGFSGEPAFVSMYNHDGAKNYRIVQSSFGTFQMDYAYNTGGYLTRIDFGDSSAAGVDRYLSYESKEYNGDNFPVRGVRYGGPGTDAQWFTADDELMGYSANTYNANGVLTQTVRYSAPGLNGLWLDADDTASFCTKFTYGPTNLLTRSEYYGDITSAGAPCAGTLYNYTLHAYDSQGRKTGEVRYGGPGPDGTWFTADDLPLTAYEYDTTW